MGKKLFKELELFLFDMDGLLFDTETIYINYGTLRLPLALNCLEC